MNSDSPNTPLERVPGASRNCEFCGEPLHFGTCAALREHWRNLQPGEGRPVPLTKSGPTPLPPWPNPIVRHG